MRAFLGLISLGVSVKAGTGSIKCLIGRVEPGFPHPVLGGLVLGGLSIAFAWHGVTLLRQAWKRNS